MGVEEMYKYFSLIEQGKNAEAELLREKDIPDRLIKFIWLDGGENDAKKFTSLENQEIWLSSIHKVNDPYEFKGMILNKTAMKDKGYPDDIISKYEELFELSGFGISCLSACDISYFPMWAYYTNNYRGFCVEYELKSKACIHEVIYEPNRIPIASLFFQLKEVLQEVALRGEYDSPKSKMLARLFMQNLFIKSKSWEHEREYRIVQPIDSAIGGNYPIAKLGMKVNRIIAGINCSEEDKQRLNEISNKINCGNAYVSKLSDSQYALVEERM